MCFKTGRQTLKYYKGRWTDLRLTNKTNSKIALILFSDNHILWNGNKALILTATGKRAPDVVHNSKCWIHAPWCIVPSLKLAGKIQNSETSWVRTVQTGHSVPCLIMYDRTVVRTGKKLILTMMETWSQDIRNEMRISLIHLGPKKKKKSCIILLCMCIQLWSRRA